MYHSNFKPLEWTVAHREDNVCYMKLVCRKSDVSSYTRLPLTTLNPFELIILHKKAIQLLVLCFNWDYNAFRHLLFVRVCQINLVKASFRNFKNSKLAYH